MAAATIATISANLINPKAITIKFQAFGFFAVACDLLLSIRDLRLLMGNIFYFKLGYHHLAGYILFRRTMLLLLFLLASGFDWCFICSLLLIFHALFILIFVLAGAWSLIRDSFVIVLRVLVSMHDRSFWLIPVNNRLNHRLCCDISLIAHWRLDHLHVHLRNPKQWSIGERNWEGWKVW